MVDLPIPRHLLEFAQVHGHWIGDAIQPSHPLWPSSPSAFSLSQHQGLFQWVSCLYQVAKFWSFSISPSNEYSVLISFKIDWFGLAVIQTEKCTNYKCTFVQIHVFLQAEQTCESCSVVWLFATHELYSPWNSPGQNTGVGSLFLLQGILPTQGSNPGLPHCRRTLYQLNDQGNPSWTYLVPNR